MRPLPLVLGLLALTGATAVWPAPAAAQDPAPPAPVAVAGRDYQPGEVVVRGDDGTQQAVDVHGPVMEAAARLERRPGVASATPNWLAHASFIPNDPGRTGGFPGGWTTQQWNFLKGPAGVDAPGAWDHLIASGRPGGKGVVVAVLDTGVAYRRYRRYRRSPDLRPRLRAGYDFVGGDRYPVDDNGHGTHVASTIAESVNNGVALTGLAYGATVMPVRVLNRFGEGDSLAIARGIRYAVRHGAQVINLSFEFTPAATAAFIPDILSALRYARRRGVLVVAASGNEGSSRVAYPARAADVLSVGAITEHACLARYSNRGTRLDLVAPGGGPDARSARDATCTPHEPPGRDILQMTFDGSVRRFGLPEGYEGTSMAAPHVSATAALVIASRVLGRRPTPGAVERRLERTADDLGPRGYDRRYGWGKVDAAAATAP